VGLTQTEQQKENRIFKSGDSLKDLWDSIKQNNICILGILVGGAENLFEEMIAENFSNLGKETYIQVQEVQRTPNKMNTIILRHIVF